MNGIYDNPQEDINPDNPQGSMRLVAIMLASALVSLFAIIATIIAIL